MIKICRRFLVVLAAVLVLVFDSSAATIWREGEASSRATVTRHPWWYDQVKTDVLSGGAWMSHFDDKKEGVAEYDFEAAEKGEYTFWVRANPLNAKLSYQLDGGEWTLIDLQKNQRGMQNIAGDNKPDLHFLAWARAGQIALAAGKHTIKFKFHSAGSHHGGLDCFVFTTGAFVPAGKMKPGAVETEHGPADWFAVIPDDDKFSPDSVIDLSKYIPAPAGQFGFLKAAGKDLKFEQGAGAVKLWGCGANLEYGKFTQSELTQRAKYLRKHGVNIVRQHAVFDDVTTGGKLDAKKLDAYDWWFAELKKHGLYTDWSVFYHFTITPEDGYDPALFAELEGKGNHRDTYGIITVAPKLWEIRNKFLVALLTHQNPYTGLRYVDDPALAVVEMQNEDSVFFWNPLGALAEPNPKKWPGHARQLRQMFAAWVKAKYKTDDALKAAWGQLRAGDSVNAAELRVMGPWELDGKGPRGTFAGAKKRAGDCIEFLAELQRGEFETCEKAMRAAGFKAVSVTTAWQVGGAATDPANTWTDTVGGMIDRHNYAGGGEGGHGIKEGKVNNESHLAHPGGGIFSVGMKQVEHQPFSITEWTQSAPNQWKLECAPIMAFYALGLQGWDASFHFMQSGVRLGDGWPRESSYVTDTPHYLGQFPALAFALHHGHIAEASIVAGRRLTKADLFTGTDALQQDFTKGGFDIKTLKNAGGIPAEAFAIGRVTTSFAGGKSEQADFAKYWDEKNKVIQAATGELTWDYGRQRILVTAPKTQAIIGRAAGETITLPGVTVEIRTPFVSLIFTPLDNQPLAQSRHILITALAQDQQTGTEYSADGKKLLINGGPPLLLEPVQATLKFAGDAPKQVRALDLYGVPTAKTAAVKADGSFVIDGTFRAYYYEVKR